MNISEIAIRAEKLAHDDEHHLAYNIQLAEEAELLVEHLLRYASMKRREGM